MLKLMHNALEAQGYPDFLGKHVVLFCMRDFNAWRQKGECLYVHRIVEMGGGENTKSSCACLLCAHRRAGFVVTPHRVEYPRFPVPLMRAVAMWYATVHGADDPLGLQG